jgi:hypothetical protein
MSGFFIFFGILCLLSPGFLMSKDEIKTDEDLIQWLMNRPLEDIGKIQFLISSGMGFILMGICMMLL